MELFKKIMKECDLPFFRHLIENSPEWQREENIPSNIKRYMDEYQDGVWLVWYQENTRIAITYHVENASSNNRPWIGTILVDPKYRHKGIGRRIIKEITDELVHKGNKSVYTAVPVEQNKWMQFLSICGFEQYKVEKDLDKMYVLLVLPLT